MESQVSSRVSLCVCLAFKNPEETCVRVMLLFLAVGHDEANTFPGGWWHLRRYRNYRSDGAFQTERQVAKKKLIEKTPNVI